MPVIPTPPSNPLRLHTRRFGFGRYARLSVLVLLLSASEGFGASNSDDGGGKSAGLAPAEWWGHIQVRDLNGAPLNPAARWYVVIFMGQECPVSNESIPVLNKLSAVFAPKGFVFVGAYVDPTADLETLRAHVADYAVSFPTADDRGHRLVKIAGAVYTPQVAVFSDKGVLLYKGRIDDRVGSGGASRPAAVHQDLRDALVAIAAGSTVSINGSRGFGCAIPEAVP
jgi:hypothetical protein